MTVRLPGHPAVQHRLHAAREHLEADHHVGPLRVQRGEHLQLPAVIVLLVVMLAEQHDVPLRHRCQDSGGADDARLIAVQHRPRGRAEAGLRGGRGPDIACRNRQQSANSNRAAGNGCNEDPNKSVIESHGGDDEFCHTKAVRDEFREEETRVDRSTPLPTRSRPRVRPVGLRLLD